MKKLLTILALAFAVMFGGMPTAAHADEPPAVGWPSESTDCATDVEILELEIATLEHDNARLTATLEEERDEHADELRDLDRRAWALQQAHDAEVNELSVIAHDATEATRSAGERIARRDMQIIRLMAKVQRLRDKVRALR